MHCILNHCHWKHLPSKRNLVVKVHLVILTIVHSFAFQHQNFWMNPSILRMASPLTRHILARQRLFVYSLTRHNYAGIYPASYHGLQCYNDSSWNQTIRRNFCVSSALFDSKDSSKVEQTVKALREEVKEKEKTATVVAAPKRSLGKRIWDEIVHYYHGFRLLFIDVGIASRLIWKVLNGISLSRREHKQLVLTSSDVFRLVPFSVFIIVPFMEFLLPVFLKFFPNMLPSTFQTESSKVSYT